MAPGCQVQSVAGNTGNKNCCIFCGGQSSRSLYSVAWADFFCYQNCGSGWVYVGCYYNTAVLYMGPCDTSIN
jgi:hypothetical protein